LYFTFFAVQLFTGDNVAVTQDPIFAYFSASPAVCEVLSEIAVADSGVVHFPSITLAGFIGQCTLSFLVHFAGGQKATIISADAIIMRTVISSVITSILSATHRVTIDVPFMIPRKCTTAVFVFLRFNIFQFPFWHRTIFTTLLLILVHSYLYRHLRALLMDKRRSASTALDRLYFLFQQIRNQDLAI
jgi:hypothetical protein